MKQKSIFLFSILILFFANQITCEEEHETAENILKIVNKIAENTNFDFTTQLNEWKSKLRNLTHLSVKEGECNVHVLIGALPLTGHLNPFIGIAQEFARRGCRVSFPLVHSKVKSLEFYANHPSLNGNFHILSMPGDTDSISLAQRADISQKSLIDFFLSIKDIIPTFMNLTKEYEGPLRDLFDDPSTRPDLVVSSPIVFPILLLSEQYEVPLVTSMPGLLFEKEIKYNHAPNGMSGFSADLNWWQRIINAIVIPAMNKLMPMLIFGPAIEYRQKFFTTNTSDPELNLRNFEKLKLTMNSFQSQYEVTHIQQTCFGLEHSQPLPPRIELTGPIFPIFDEPIKIEENNEKNSENVLQFLERNEKEGVIYVALGTQAVINPSLALRLLEGLGETKKAVLWSLPMEQRQFLPSNYTSYIKNFHLVPYIQQRALLQHPSIRLFLSHTGASSAHESLFYGVPIVCLPFFGDQFDVCKRVVDTGSALAIDKVKSSSSDISSALLSVISDPSYKENAMRVGRIFRSCGGISRAMDVIQRELDVGSDHLRLPHRKFHWFFQYEWDIFLSEVAIYLGVPYCLFRVVLWILRKLFFRFISKKRSEKKEKTKTQ